MEGRERGETLIFQGFWRVWPQKTVAWIGESASTEGSDPSVETHGWRLAKVTERAA